MASNTINQGAVNGIVIKPIWGTLDKQEEDDSVDRFIAIVDSIRKLVDSKADIDHNHDDRYYTEPEIDTKFLAIDVEISQINSKLTPMYGYCETAASVAAKTVTIINFTLVTGRTVYIKFEHENSADDPTLNISGTGSIRIVRYGTDPVSEQEIQWSDGEVKCFTYDGTSWIESGGAGGSDREDTISFHGSDMIVEPGTNRITFDDSDMIIHPPDGAAWLERTMEALEGGVAIISTNNEHAAISNGQYVYIRMDTSLPDGLYKATTDIAQNAELTASNVVSASGVLNDKSNVGHTHDDRYYTESETEMKLGSIYDDIFNLQQWKSDINHTHRNIINATTDQNYILGLRWSGELTTSDWFCAWAAEDGFQQVVRAISASNAKKRLSSALPTIKYKDVAIYNFSVNGNGYAAFPSASKPTAPTGYTLFFVSMLTWGRWSPDGDDRWSILVDGNYIMGPPNKTVNHLYTRWFFILSENIATG